MLEIQKATFEGFPFTKRSCNDQKQVFFHRNSPLERYWQLHS
jgi:hypothetical protein